MKKKVLNIISIVIIIIVIVGLFTSYIDSARVRNSIEPKYVLKFVSKDGNKVTYLGIGYKVIRYPSVSPDEPYKNNRGVKYGGWFMKYELSEDRDNITYDELNEVNNKIIEYFTLNGVGNYKNYSYNYVDEKNKVVIVGLIDASKEKQDEFRKLVVDSDLIKFEKGEIMINDNLTSTEIE